MLRTSVLLSGSKGNATLVFTDNTYLLIDAGLSAKRIFAALDTIRIEPNKLDAILITHEHSDHVKGAGVVSRKLNIPIYLTESTYKYCSNKLGNLKIAPIHFNVGDDLFIGDININAFSSSHDAIDSCNFVFQKKDCVDKKLVFATDLGIATKLLLKKLENATTIILESNHDEKILLEGPYPWELKQRVKSNNGHLSNKQAVAVISQVVHSNLNNLILAHLSETNNTPELAEKEMREYIQAINHTLNLYIAEQNNPTPVVVV